MDEMVWNILRDSLADRGLRAPDHLMPNAPLADQIAVANGVGSEMGLEWLAEHFQLLPFGLHRPTCTTKAEAIFRRLARQTDDDEPWLPFGTVGPLLICGHYNPVGNGLWMIPPSFIIPVLVPQEQYESLRGDIAGRLGFKPLDDLEPLGTPELPDPEAGLGAVFEWLTQCYPFDQDEEEQLIKCHDELAGLKDAAFEDSSMLPKHYGLALNYIAHGEFCFAADQAPPQEAFPDTILEKHGVYPMFVGQESVYLLSSSRENFAFEDEWYSTGHDSFRFHFVLAESDAILATISKNRGRGAVQAGAATMQQVGELTHSDVENLVDIDIADVQRVNPSSINSTPEQVIHWVLYNAINARASDLHIEKYYNMARFRGRIDGELRVLHSCPEELLPRYIALIKNYSNMGQRRQEAQDGRFAMRLGKRRVDCRVSAVPCRRELQKITIRFLDKQGGVKQLTELNLAQRQLDLLNDTMARDQGLALITGPTGSGKTTTLYAMLNSVNSEHINIHTIEDPIEYEIEGMNQTQTDPINGLTFPEGLRRLLRADPDVMLIGESRDEETANAAINAALTGHLVLTTLHANDSLRAISRLISMGVPPFLLSDALCLSQAQRLVRRLCLYCKRPTPLSPDVRAVFRVNQIDVPGNIQSIYSAVGCAECSETGYTGRIALMELCPIDSDLSDMVSLNKPQSEMREHAIARGLLSLYQEGLLQVLAGHTTLEEINCLAYTGLTPEAVARLEAA